MTETPHRVLILEDQATDAELAEYHLRQAGMEIDCLHVEDRQSFERALDTFRPDVILSDFGLPGFSGLEALDLARSRHPEVPFIFVSGTIGEEVAVEFLKRGATDYLLKTNLTRLAPAVSRALPEAAEHRAKLRAQERVRHLAAIIEATPDLVATADRHGTFLYLNQAGRELLGIGPEQDISRLSIPDIYPDPMRTFIVDHAIPAAKRDGVWSGETTLLGRDGREFPVSQVGIVHRAADGGIAFLSTIARDITQQKAQQARIQRLNRVYAVLSGINSTLVRVRERQELLDEACRIAVEHGLFRLAWIGLVGETADDVDVVACAGMDDGYLDEVGITGKNGQPKIPYPAIAQTLRGGEPVIFDDLDRELLSAPIRDSINARCFRSAALLPLQSAGKTVCIMALYAGETGFFDDEELRLLTELSGDIGFALEVIEKEERLNYLAYYDALTGLPNRDLFYDRLGRLIGTAVASRSGIAVLALNLERFRAINETFGMNGGDALLRQFAARVNQLISETSTVARIGADEFAIAVPDIRDAETAAELLNKRLLALWAEPFPVADQLIRVSAKVGIALYPDDGRDATTLLLNAEAALANTRKSGDRYLFYAPAMNARIAAKLDLENRLRSALLEDQFVLHYQPKVAIDSGCILGVEALIRWNAPDLGLVSPGEFIPLLEETGLILEVGRWAMSQAARDYRMWCAQHPQPPKVAVNVSALQLREKDFVAMVAEVVATDASLSAGLEVEITESLIMQDIDEHIPKLAAIRELGLTIAIDDFGTGYSSLNYLAKLPATTLKIDRSFIVDMLRSRESRHIVATMISLAHALGMIVVAEGVDATEQLALLKELGCDQIQGYLFSPPVPAAQIMPLLGGTVAQ